MHSMNKRESIYFQLLLLLVLSAAAAVFAFFILNYVGEYAIDRYYSNSDYEERRNRSYVEKLQKYVGRNQIFSRNASALKDWVKSQKIISIRIYKDGIQIFNSDYPEKELWVEEIEANEYEWETYYPVEFADGEARVSIFGVYAYQFYSYAHIAELLTSFVFFLILVLRGIRRKMHYILKLNEEIEILEGGRLDYQITVEGKDELSALAKGLDSMRLSFCRLLEENARMAQENQKVITEMSHDLRTPVTSILLYTEIIRKGNYKNEEQLKEYMEKIDRKARRMKQLTNHLFEYSLVTGEGEIVLEAAERFETLFYDLLSETCSYLEQKGIQTVCEIEWYEEKLRTCTDYLMRIMDNITSNIIKYADSRYPVKICSFREEETVGLFFENRIKSRDKSVQSTCVGIQSIKSMMAKMGGSCEAGQSGGLFQVKLRFSRE